MSARQRIFRPDGPLSIPQSDAIALLIERVLKSTAKFSTVELGASLGVDSSYITKLRQGWRPSRMRPEILKRFEQFDPTNPLSRAQPRAFYDGVLFAAQAMAETTARLIAEARAGLATPTHFAPDERLDLAAEGFELKHADARESAPRRRARG